MTAFEIYRRLYLHHYGKVLSHIWAGVPEDPKRHIMQLFEDDIEECHIVCATPTAIILDYDGDDTNKKVANSDVLGAIIAQAGYWLCHYDGHTGSWALGHYSSRDEAKVAYKDQYMHYFRHQDWYHIFKVR